MLKIDRRSFMAASAAGALLFGPAGLLAQETVNTDELHAPGELGDKVLGPPDAPVTVVEYASMSCPHCGAFHRDTFGDFRIKYIDSGKVRFIFREFPLDAAAFAVAMVARCAPADRFFEVVGTYFDTQQTWLQSVSKDTIFDVADDFGFTQQSFDACLSNQALFAGLEGVRNRAGGFGVRATPTFFINGKKLEGALSLEDMDREIEPLL